MIISRRRYERDLQEAHEKGVCEAEERCNQTMSFERVWKKIYELEEMIRRAEPNQGSCCSKAAAGRLAD